MHDDRLLWQTQIEHLASGPIVRFHQISRRLQNRTQIDSLYLQVQVSGFQACIIEQTGDEEVQAVTGLQD